jgi:DNA-binding response OmpR family regulator
MSLVQITEHQPDHYQDAHLEVLFRQRLARLDAKPLQLTRKEYDLLAVLVANAGEIVERAALLEQVWGYSDEIRTRTLDVHIRRLRKKLGEYADQYIETIFSVGYRFQPYRAPRRLGPPAAGPPVAVIA